VRGIARVAPLLVSATCATSDNSRYEGELGLELRPGRLREAAGQPSCPTTHVAVLPHAWDQLMCVGTWEAGCPPLERVAEVVPVTSAELQTASGNLAPVRGATIGVLRMTSDIVIFRSKG
jgi:hypothetical protein